MEFEELMRARHSVRKLSDRPVSEEQIEAILKAAQIAPSAVNKQPYKIFVLRTPEAIKRAGECCRFDFVPASQVVFVVGAKADEAWVRPADGHNFAEVDAAIAAAQMMLEIANLGLGSTWVGHFDPEKLKGFFPQTRGFELIAMFGVGYPAEDSTPNQRHFEYKSMEKLAERI